VSNVFGRVRGHGQTKRNLREAFTDRVLLLPSAEASNAWRPPSRILRSVGIAELRRQANELRARYACPSTNGCTGSGVEPPATQAMFR